MLDINVIKSLENVRTPFYFYNMELLENTLKQVAALVSEYDVEIHYAVKANVEERILRMIASYGFGADCVSGNEVLKALKCGFPADKIVFAGVGKTDREIYDALQAGIASFNCESLQELYVIDSMAGRYGLRANVSARINPDIDAHTHKYVTTGLNENKFGIQAFEFDAFISLLEKCGNVDFNGLHFHVGSQITDIGEVFSLACEKANEIMDYFESRGLEIKNIDMGGGLGIDYENPDGNPVPDFRTWLATVASGLKKKKGQKVHLEPGRAMVAQCGTLMSRVLFVKNGETKNFLVLDAGMNDLIRPALYGSYHKIENLSAAARPRCAKEQMYDVVGPVCESSDVWGTGRCLPLSVRGDLMAIRSAGAYGQVMASMYNLKDFAPAVYSDELDKAPVREDLFGQAEQ